MSVRDLSLLAEKLIVDFPEYYPMFSEQTYEFDGRAPANSRNRNPLLGLGIGADGLKTGHTTESVTDYTSKTGWTKNNLCIVRIEHFEDRARKPKLVTGFSTVCREKFWGERFGNWKAKV